MSQYVKIEAQFNSKRAARAALRNIGIPDSQIEEDAEGNLQVRTYQGAPSRLFNPDGDKVHLRVDRSNVGNLCNDFGIRFGEAGNNTSQLFLCDYAKNTEKFGRFPQEYAFEATREHYESQGRTVYREDDVETGKTHVFVGTGG